MNSETISLIGNQLEEENQEAIRIILKEIREYSGSIKWLVDFVAFCLPKNKKEEWLGDLYQSLDLVVGEYAQRTIHLMIISNIAILIISSLEIKISDLLGK